MALWWRDYPYGFERVAINFMGLWGRCINGGVGGGINVTILVDRL